MAQPPRKFGRLISSRPPAGLSAVPSQRPSQIPAFDPREHPSAAVHQAGKPAPGQGEIAGDPSTQTQPAPRQASHTQAVFDSRPPQAWDWYFNDKWFQVPAGSGFALPAQASILGGFTVPNSYIAIIRELNFQIYESIDPIDGALHLPMAVSGDNDFATTAEVVMLRMIVDGVPTPYWTPNIAGLRGVPIWEAFFAAVRIPMFIPVPEGAIVTAEFAIPNVSASVFNIYAQYHGNLLPETGRVLTNEYGTQPPQPVREQGAP